MQPQLTKKRGRPNNQERQLNQELIIYMAKALMRKQEKVPSIRGLARALDVDAMAIYHYFDNKSRLLEAILTSLMDSLYVPKNHQPWQEALMLLSESYLNLLTNYSGLLDVLITMPSDGPMTVFTERFNKIVSPRNLPLPKQQHLFILLLNFLHGQVLLIKTTADADLTKTDLKAVLNLYCTLVTSE